MVGSPKGAVEAGLFQPHSAIAMAGRPTTTTSGQPEDSKKTVSVFFLRDDLKVFRAVFERGYHTYVGCKERARDFADQNPFALIQLDKPIPLLHSTFAGSNEPSRDDAAYAVANEPYVTQELRFAKGTLIQGDMEFERIDVDSSKAGAINFLLFVEKVTFTVTLMVALLTRTFLISPSTDALRVPLWAKRFD